MPAAGLKSPVDLFRELLAMNATERETKLASRPPATRQAILAKLREYEAMEPGEREVRLQATQLRWDLLKMVNLSSDQRSNFMAQLPERERQSLTARLAEWDKLPAEVQQELLANQATIRYFTEIEGRSDEQRRKILEGLSPARRQKLQEGIDKWNNLPADQRRNILDRFTQFFDLTGDSPTDRALLLRKRLRQHYGDPHQISCRMSRTGKWQRHQRHGDRDASEHIRQTGGVV